MTTTETITHNTEILTKLISKYESHISQDEETSISAIEVLEKYKINVTHAWLVDMIKNNVIINPGTGRNDVVVKYAAMICILERLTREETLAIAKAVFNSCKDSNLTTFDGWINQMTNNNKLYDSYKNHVNKFIRDNNYPLTQYALSAAELQENKKYYHHIELEKIENQITSIDEKDPKSIKDNILRILVLIKDFDEIEQENILGKLKIKTKVGLQTLRRKLDELRDLEKMSSNVARAVSAFTNKLDLAEKFYKIQPIYFDDKKNFWLWEFDEFKWKIVDKTDLLIMISENSYANTIDTKDKTEIIEALSQIGRKRKPKDPSKSWIQFKNKIIDLTTGEELLATHEYFVTNPIPWELGESEETPILDKLFREWVTSDEEKDRWVKTLYEVTAFCLLSSYPLDVCVALLGKGSNGKTTFIEFITKLVGQDNVTTADLKQLVSNRFEAWNLYKKLVCTMGEIDFGILRDTKAFKKVTGRDLMSFERKGSDPIRDYNYAKLIIATNGLPETYDKTDGFYRRWLLIDFPHQFQQIHNFLNKTISDQEYKNMCRKSIRILKELLTAGEFTNQGDIAARQLRYEERANPVGVFLKDHCIISAAESTPFWKIYNNFVDFLKIRNFRLQSKIEFSRALKNKGFEITTPIPTGAQTGDGKLISWTHVKGIQLKEEIHDEIILAEKTEHAAKETRSTTLQDFAE